LPFVNNDWEHKGTMCDINLCQQLRQLPHCRLKATLNIDHEGGDSEEFKIETSVNVNLTASYAGSTVDSLHLGTTLDLLYSTPGLSNLVELPNWHGNLHIDQLPHPTRPTDQPLNRALLFPYRAGFSPVHKIVYSHLSSTTDSADTMEHLIADYASLLGRSPSLDDPDKPFSSQILLLFKDTKVLRHAINGVSRGSIKFCKCV
jgi:hypothetical protein